MKKLIPFLACFILAIIPFFWMKPGEVNLGGDSSRLYFYDPLNYLKNFPLYNVSPGETGGETINYFFIPFTSLLLFLLGIIRSPYLLITLVNSFTLVSAFVFVYLILRELLQHKAGELDTSKMLSGIGGGLFYALELLGPNWDKPLVTHNQIFLNPLMFWLLLRFINSPKIAYLLIAILISFVFAPNFSFIGAPPFFAFYPLALLYLFVYGRYVKKVLFSWKKLIACLLLLLSLHAFHLVPQISFILESGSNLYQRVFLSDETSNFLGALEGVKLANNLSATAQGRQMPFDFLSFAFLGVLIGGLMVHMRVRGITAVNKSFTFLFIFLLVIIFFTSANITDIGLNLYKGFFKIPGFGIFRNFYGQFLYALVFFYALTFGVALYCLLHMLKNQQYRIGIFVSLSLLIIFNGWPFIKGEMVNLPVLGSTDVKVPFKMDPEFEKVLTYIRELPQDGKFLTLPFTYFGYQLLSGTEGGLYIGPSMIGYLTGKKDFTGYASLSPFGDLFFSLVSQGDYKGLKMLLSWLNIRYIFYNEDAYIYDNFLRFPYINIVYYPISGAQYGVKRYFPAQSSIQDFIANVKGEKIYQDGKYSIYKIEDYLPHLYVAKEAINVQNFQNDWRFPLELTSTDPRIVFYEPTPLSAASDEVLAKAQRKGLISDPSRIPYSILHPPEGEYEVYVKHALIKELGGESLRIESNNQTLVPLEESTSSSWIRFENLKFAKIDGDVIPLDFTIQNFNPSNIKFSWQKQVTQEGIYVLSSPLENWNSQRQYLLTFQYNTNGQSIFLQILQAQQVKEGVKNSVLLEQGINSQGWSQYQNVLAADPYVTSASIQFIAGNEELLLSGIKDFAIVPIYQPEIVLRKVPSGSPANIIVPKITFAKINPTKYAITVEAAQKPFTLVFLDAFNSNWKLFLADNRGERADIVATYFDGEVKENLHKNIFFDTHTFETFGKKPIADNGHFLANGYANAWYIRPQDVEGKTTYTLILEMTSQRLIYLTLPISLLALLICVVWLIVLALRVKNEINYK